MARRQVARLWDSDDVLVRVSVASAYQRFHGCEPDYIRDVCKARCCDAPTKPGGTMVTIHASEEDAIRARGGEVRDGLLVTDGRCTFKDDLGLCSLHFTPDKPFGCIASPFTLNRSDTLVVRNRYRLLRCYATQSAKRGEDVSGFPPAFEAFRASLDLIFGDEGAAALVERLVAGGDPKAGPWHGEAFVPTRMPARSYAVLTANDATKRAAGA